MPCLSGFNAILTPFRGWVRVHLSGQRVARRGTLQKAKQDIPSHF